MSHLTNPLASSVQLARFRDRATLPMELLDVAFFATQSLTQAAGLLLELPQSTTACANVVLARFWVMEAAAADDDHKDDYEFLDLSAAVLYVVAKMGAQPRTVRDVANVYRFLGGGDSNKNSVQDCYVSEADYGAFRRRLLALEARVLATLGFDTHVALPHALAVTYLQALGFLGTTPTSALSRRAVLHLNTALLSPQMLYLTHQPHELAVAAVYLAARDVGCRVPAGAWWEVFDVDRETLGFLAVALQSVAGWLADAHERMPSLFEGGVGAITRQRLVQQWKDMEA